MNKYFGWIFLLTFLWTFVGISAHAQIMFRWKDQDGVSHVSDQPPPLSCISDDCRRVREGVDRKIREEHAAAEAKKKAAKLAEEKKWRDYQKREADRNIALAEGKALLNKCLVIKSGCTFEKLSSEMRYLAAYEGQEGVLAGAGQPAKRQIANNSNTEYWYYYVGSNSMQLVWSRREPGALGPRFILDSVNLN